MEQGEPAAHAEPGDPDRRPGDIRPPAQPVLGGGQLKVRATDANPPDATRESGDAEGHRPEAGEEVGCQRHVAGSGEPGRDPPDVVIEPDRLVDDDDTGRGADEPPAGSARAAGRTEPSGSAISMSSAPATCISPLLSAPIAEIIAVVRTRRIRRTNHSWAAGRLGPSGLPSAHDHDDDRPPAVHRQRRRRPPARQRSARPPDRVRARPAGPAPEGVLRPARAQPPDRRPRRPADRDDGSGRSSTTAFRTPPALHRFPGNMAKRVRELAAYLVERYDGDASRIWTRGEGRRRPLRAAARPAGLRADEGRDAASRSSASGSASRRPAGRRSCPTT